MQGGKNKLIDTYFKNYKKFLFVPMLILVVALFLIFSKYQSTGDFINRDITLKGGVSLTVLESKSFDLEKMESELSNQLAPNDVSIRLLNSAGNQVGFIVESDIQELSPSQLNSTLQIIGSILGQEIGQEDYSFETMGASLGKSFFNQTFRALIIAFIFMGIVVFIYFRTLVPSTAVILSAFSDIITTVAVINLMGFKIGTAGIAALLMLVGYSIDTDIMLTTRVLKRKESTVKDAFRTALKTGMTMTLTTVAAVTIALIFSESEVIRQIMTILIIGLLIDIMNTWVQNAGLLIWYVERKK